MTPPRVQHSGLVPRTVIDDAVKGSLFVAEDISMPIPIRRVYVIHGVLDSGIVRGGHAHYKNDQVMFVLQGALTLHLDDGKISESLRLSKSDDGIRLGTELWHSMSDFTPDCMALVLASQPYDENDYIRDYEAFKKYVSTI